MPRGHRVEAFSTIDRHRGRLDDEGMRTDEAPGGTVGCDVCGIDLAQEQGGAHRAWHQHQEERLEQLIRAVEELIAELRNAPRTGSG